MSKINNILIVEDDRFISELYSRALKKVGYNVEAVVTGPKGLALAKTGRFELVLLDIMIPDMTGIDVLKEIRGADGQGMPQTKVIITTNLDQDDSTRSSLESEADGYLIKADVTPRRLIELIRQLEQFGEVPASEASDNPL